MRVSEVVQRLESWIPSELAESWDNVGLLLGDPEALVTGLLCTIDATPEVVAEAEAMGANFILAYHPPLFRPVRRVLAGDLAHTLLRAGMAVYSPHTALDAVEQGPNALLAERLGLSGVRPLRPDRSQPARGAGRLGALASLPDVDTFIALVRVQLGLERLMVAGAPRGPIHTVAVCAGAAGGLLDDAIAAGADALVCGELTHHDALKVARVGMLVVCTLHSNTERLALAPLAARLRGHVTSPVHVSLVDRDPFQII